MFGHTLGEVEDGCLGSRIVDQFFVGILRIHRDGVDDAGARRQVRDGCLAEAEDVIDVGLEDAIELLIGDFEDIGLALLVGRVVHQEIQSTELLEGLADHLFVGGLATDVGRQGDGLAANRNDQLDHFLGVGFFGGVIVDGHIRPPPASEGDGHGATDTAVAAGDQRLAAG